MTRPVAGRTDNDFADQVGDVPRMAEVPTPFGFQMPGQLTHGPGSRAAKHGGKLNLRAVADVLETYGLDPIEELAKVIVKEEPVLDRSGQPVIDPETGKPKMKAALDTDTRVRTLMELAQYSRPKLKSVEVTTKAPELTDDQIDRRLEALLAARAKRG